MIVPSVIKTACANCSHLAYKVGVHDVRFPNTREERPIDMSSPSIVLDPNKCILCGDCVRTCDEIQGVGAINFAFRGSKTQVMPAFDKKISETECVGCGQCAAVCPTAAISIRSNVSVVWDADRR